MDKKQQQLGMNPSTASGRLVKDTLFRLAVEAGHVCYRCQGQLTRETFSIEHKQSWLDTPDPVGAFFDQSNIAFSHLLCNTGEARRGKPPVNKKYADERECWREGQRRLYTPEKRRAKYLRSGH